MKLNHRLSYERKLRGWSQAKVAELTGTTPVNVGRWERGISKPRPYFQERLCEIFGKDACSLGLFQQNGDNMRQEKFLPWQVDFTPKKIISDTFPARETAKPKIYDSAIPLQLLPESGLVGRDHLMKQIKEDICVYKKTTLALHGLSGVGKTSLAMALVKDVEMLLHFYDGFLWATLGPEASVLGQMKRWGKLLGVSEKDAESLQDISKWSEILRFHIGQRKMLLIIDDAWNIEDASAFKIGGPHCTHLLTTRFSHVAAMFDPHNSIHVTKLSLEDSLALLERLIPDVVYNESELVQALIRQVEGLPLSLHLIANAMCK